METNVLFGGLEELGNLRLGEPYGLSVQTNLEPSVAVFGLFRIAGVQASFGVGRFASILRQRKTRRDGVRLFEEPVR